MFKPYGVTISHNLTRTEKNHAKAKKHLKKDDRKMPSTKWNAGIVMNFTMDKVE